jgi:GNAT superfamily N-acetyltransferase
VVEAADGIPVGAVSGPKDAWCGVFAGEDAGYGFVAPDIPELTIGVLRGHRGTEAGTALMERLIGRGSSRGLRAISLSVEDGNRARLLYERV